MIDISLIDIFLSNITKLYINYVWSNILLFEDYNFIVNKIYYIIYSLKILNFKKDRMFKKTTK